MHLFKITYSNAGRPIFHVCAEVVVTYILQCSIRTLWVVRHIYQSGREWWHAYSTLNVSPKGNKEGSKVRRTRWPSGRAAPANPFFLGTCDLRRPSHSCENAEAFRLLGKDVIWSLFFQITRTAVTWASVVCRLPWIFTLKVQLFWSKRSNHLQINISVGGSLPNTLQNLLWCVSRLMKTHHAFSFFY